MAHQVAVGLVEKERRDFGLASAELVNQVIRRMLKMKSIRINILIPVDLAEEIKKVVGPRKRSSFLVEAAWEKLERMKLADALKKAAGA